MRGNGSQGQGIIQLREECGPQQRWGYPARTPIRKWLCWRQHFGGAGCPTATRDTLGWRGTFSSSPGCSSSFADGVPCWLALVVPKCTPAGMERSFLLRQQWDEVQHPGGLPHCSTHVPQGSALAHSAPRAGEQRRELG